MATAASSASGAKGLRLDSKVGSLTPGKVRKWKGRLLNVDLNRLRRELEDSRDYIFSAAKVPRDLFAK